MKRVLLYALIFSLLFLVQALHAQVNWQNKQYDVDSLVPKAAGYLRAGQLNESITLSRTVLLKYPKYTDFKYILGLSYQKMGRADWAIPNLEEVVSNAPTYRDAYLSLAALYESSGQYEKATVTWQSALKHFPQDTEIIRLNQEFDLRNLRRNRDANMDIWYKKGRDFVGKGDALQALAYSDSIQRADSTDNRFLYLRSSALMVNKEYDRAKADFENLWGKGDSSIFVTEQLANIAVLNKDYSRALVYMNRLLDKSPENEQYRHLAKVYRENLPYKFYIGANHMQSSQDRPNGHFFISGLEYGQKIGAKNTLIGQFNYGNRRGEKGYQVGLDAWINYSKNLYAYHQVAWADGSVFPTWRASYSLYREAELWLFDLGGRYVRANDNTNNYGLVASAGRYFGSTFVYLRGFLLRDEQRWNQAYSLAVRHYYNSEKPDSYVTLIGNIGTSPDDPSRYQFLNNRFGFLSRSINAGWQHRIDNWGFTVMGGWSYYKVAENRFMNQYDLNLSLRKYF
ncbi:Beta-barrel assembly-enhancing protease [compost metagenome]